MDISNKNNIKNIPGRDIPNIDDNDDNYDLSILKKDNKETNSTNFRPLNKEQLQANLEESLEEAAKDQAPKNIEDNKNEEVIITNITNPEERKALRDEKREKEQLLVRQRLEEEERLESLMKREKSKAALNKMSNPLEKKAEQADNNDNDLDKNNDIKIDFDNEIIEEDSNNLLINRNDSDDDLPINSISILDDIDNFKPDNNDEKIVKEDIPNETLAIKLEEENNDHTLEAVNAVEDLENATDQENNNTNKVLSESPFVEEEKNNYAQLRTTELRKIIRDSYAETSFPVVNSAIEVLRHGYLDIDQLGQFLVKASEENIELETLLVDQGILKDEDALRLKAAKNKIDYINLEGIRVDPGVANYLTKAEAKQYEALPYAASVNENDDLIVYVAIDPANILVVKKDIPLLIKESSGGQTKLVAASSFSINELINNTYKDEFSDEEFQEIVDEFGEIDDALLDEDDDMREASFQAQEEPAVKAVNQILSSALTVGASDIHCEPVEKGPMKIRFRIDGILNEMQPIPRKIQGEVINKFKTMAEIDIANKNISQDGRASFAIGDRRVDLRMVTMPTIYGENVVIRILDSSAVNLSIADLGYSESTQDEIINAVKMPHGAVLITGPTGSGKTTTLYSALSILDHKEQNIFTVEDPVEYRLDGINQCQVNEKKGMTFAHALRGFMRADPDVIMVGEIRDGETARICIESALTGHLVLSTLHTNDAASAIARLVEMEVEPYALASTLECIVAQRLARKLCKFCKEEYLPTEEEMRFNEYPEEMIKNPEKYNFHKASSMGGCVHCNQMGYKGRLAVCEVLSVSDTIKEMIVQGKSSNEIKKQAMQEGMLSLSQDGFVKVGEGLTTVEEMKRVTM